MKKFKNNFMIKKIKIVKNIRFSMVRTKNNEIKSDF